MTIQINPELKLVSDPEKLFDRFYEDCVDRGLTEETIGNYKSILKHFALFLKSRGLPLWNVDRYVLRDFIHYRRTQGVKQKTLENNFSALATLYDYLSFEGHIQVNPVMAVRKRFLVRYKSGNDEDDPPRKLISVDDMATLANSILNIRDKAIVLLLAKTGVRRSELIHMDLEDVNWAEGSIKLKRFKKRSNRVVFFDDECAATLKRWIKMRNQLNPKDKALFIGPRGERLQRHGIYSTIVKYAEHLGLHNANSPRPEDHFTPHCFRHWFTTWLLRNGMPREYVKELRGDRRGEAIDIYHHIDREELRRTYLACIPKLGV